MKVYYLIIISFLLVLSSCGNNESKKNEKEKLSVDTTLTEKAQAFKLVNEELKQDINNSALYLKRAYLYKKYDDLASAIDDLDRAIKIDSVIPEFYLLKAELLKSQNKFKEAKLTLDKCMMVDNGNVQARVELGWLALIVKDYKQALDYADAALKRNIYTAEAYYLKGMIFEEKGDTALAISSFITATEQESDYYDAYLHLGILHFNINMDLAKAYLKNALDIDSKRLEALYAYALCCQERGEYDEAIEVYHKMLTINQYREPYFNLGYIHQEYLKNYEVAIENYTKAIGVSPSYFEAYYNRGLCYEELENFKSAEKDFRKTLQINPTYDYAAIALERVLQE